MLRYLIQANLNNTFRVNDYVIILFSTNDFFLKKKYNNEISVILVICDIIYNIVQKGILLYKKNISPLYILLDPVFLAL